MNQNEIRCLIGAVSDGHLSRRGFIQRLAAVGLTAPMASMLLVDAGVAQPRPAHIYAPTKRGGGGVLRLLWWQAPTLLNPHFANGNKDQDASRIFYEPLASWTEEGDLLPVLAAKIPSREDRTVSADGLTVTWTLKQGVKWHDGKTFTADDVVFTWDYSRDQATATVTRGSYVDIKVEKIDSQTVKITFDKPTPFWASCFTGGAGMILPKHVFGQFIGANSRDAPANLKPVGTGPFKCVEFKPGDSLKGEINADYHIANMPHFDTVELKGGGDAVSAARAVIQTGEFDFGWNMQVEDEVLQRVEQGGKGRAVIVGGGSIEFLRINFSDPHTEVDGERSSPKSKHPAFQDKAVREALSYLVDRASVEKFIYGRTGLATANVVNNPQRHRSKTTTYEFSIDKANAILDKAGWARGTDGIRTKGGAKLKWVYQTTINGPRQKTQAIVKQAAAKAGIDIELKSIVASVFFSSDVANPDTIGKFFADLQMNTATMGQPDAGIFLRQFTTKEMTSKENKWLGRNYNRYANPEYDKAWIESESELDPVKRAALLIRCNDILVEDIVVIPIVYRPSVHAQSLRLRCPLSDWDSPLCQLNSWYREG